MIKDRLQHFIDNCDKSLAKRLIVDALKEIEQLEATIEEDTELIEKLQAKLSEIETRYDDLCYENMERE